MTRGILYYNRGRKNLARLCVSLYTLRQVYDGTVTIICGDEPPAWFRAMVCGMDAEIIRCDMSSMSALTGKASLWRYSPFDLTLYLDADTLVLRDPSQLFPIIEEHGFVVTQFCHWQTASTRIGKRLRSFAPVATEQELKDALAFGPALNTGVVGWMADHPILPVWESTTREAWEKKCLNRMVDELACQVVVPRFNVKVMPDVWNWSPKFSRQEHDSPNIVHFHGYKHVHPYPMCVYWKCIWHKLRAQYGISSLPPDGDRRLTRYTKELPDGLTRCTVVNAKYADKFNKNVFRWNAMKGLKDKPLIVFRVGNAPLSMPAGATVVNVPDTPSGWSDREWCLTQYVLGPDKHVKTSHWMKLDADCEPKEYEFPLPDYHGYAIAAHRWGYTRVKGDPGATKHWLNTLDDWYWGEPVNYPADIPVRSRHGHKRINSYCAIYQTSFTKQVAEKCGERLPVPSEDTTTFYLAQQWHLPILRYNAKRWFSQ